MLKLCSEGQVKRLQRLLGRGFFSAEAIIDGDFGVITEAAVKAFQSSTT